MSDYIWKLTQEELHHKQNFAWEQGILHERERIINLIENKQIEITLPDDSVHIEYNALHDIIDAIRGKL